MSYRCALFHVGGQNTCPRTFRELPGEQLSSSDEVEAGQRVYTPLVLWGYDLLVLGFSNRFVWRCRSSRMLERYNAYVGERHLDVGVGTGWFLDHCNWPVEMPQITLLDLNENPLSVASKRIRRYAPATIQANVLDPVDLGDVRFDSIGANYLFHCLPGELESKGVGGGFEPASLSRFGRRPLREHDPRPWGVWHNLLGRRLMRLYNRKGTLSNLEDDQRGLEQGLASKLTGVEVDVVGAVALFAGRL